MLRGEMHRDDLDASYSGCYLGYMDGHNQPVVVTGVSGTYLDPCLDLEAYNGRTYNVYLDDPSLSLDVPDSQMYYNNGVRYFSRDASRQWRRGITRNCCRVYAFTMRGGELTARSHDVTHEHLSGLYNLQTGSRGKILSKRLAVVHGATPHLIYMGTVITNAEGKLQKRYTYLEGYVRRYYEDM